MSNTPSVVPRAKMLAAEDALQALIYLDAAERVIGPDMSFGDAGTRFMQDIPMIGPSGLLVSHAAEIAMNSYLSAFGVKAKESSNHDLVGRLSAIDEVDATVADIRFRQYVRAINAAHKNHQFRYARSRQEPFISARGAIEMVRPTIAKIHSMVSEKVFGHRAEPPRLP